MGALYNLRAPRALPAPRTKMKPRPTTRPPGHASAAGSATGRRIRAGTTQTAASTVSDSAATVRPRRRACEAGTFLSAGPVGPARRRRFTDRPQGVRAGQYPEPDTLKPHVAIPGQGPVGEHTHLGTTARMAA